MMQIPMKVALGDGSEVEVIAKASDLIAFERHFDKPMTTFGDPRNGRVEYILWLAHHVMVKQDKTTLDFDAWVDSIETVSVGDSGE